ncbi:amino-acid N-acetyltransferase [Cellvibrio japonicus]|uniref:Amino-acid acetyltransferase n=1 Tax=Cellvibrio japonicus (strain Ueda107) TaxID=498211 RepID=B3PIW8_CELJU|nr:amino-acid N-acetyltransferase [Cellvibrio japonicus]ACE85699.1 amino-acid N-acetyltransferase [Cellvibrio japonicus Ueda107]QEI11177.1 amino-acid N-acetyltransferase [Cellvibrio japonicus]QEI14751.1 amino-acid N-acetyltransferase [Cellvibrio japonicus]QEI18331.1 amino-acid N-acetyltransferase [Cellvibrio japonicus]
MPNISQDYVKWFRHSSPYINKHRGRTFVLMLPGEGIKHPNFHNIIHDVALLSSLGVRLVLVHGARPQIDERLQVADTYSNFHKNLRITDSESLSLVIQAIGEARTTVEAALSTGLPNSPMHGADMQVISGNFVVAMPYGVIEGIDLQHTGKVRRINTRALHTALDSGAVVLLSPCGYSPTGEVFNLSFSDVATHVAIAIKADKLLAFIEGDGVLDDDSHLIRQLSLQECKHYLETYYEKLGEHANPDLQQAVSACYLSCLQGVPRAQLVSYTTDGALLTELFTRDGLGTMIYSGHYEQLRSATIDDVGGILELIRPLEEEGILVRRSREVLETEISKFHVMEKDGAIIACAALYPYGDTAELSCVATHPDYRKGGRAALLLQQVEHQARKQKIKQLFLLTTQTAHWFIEQGFMQGKLDDLPVQRQLLYNYQRNSKIFIKSLV